MAIFSRADNSVLSRWWWTVDKWTLSLLSAIILMGVFLNFAASPAVAERIGLSTFYFVQRHLIILPVAVAAMIGLSLTSQERIKQIALILFVVSLGLVALTLGFGMEIKGARRWLSIGGFSLQPSELLKPAFAVVSAWIFAQKYKVPTFPGYTIAVGMLVIVLGLLLLQPDLGMSVVITVVFGVQFFLAGLPLSFVMVLMLLGACGLIGAYFIFPHVQKRIDLFLDPSTGDSYQVQKSLNAFREGGFFGVGPGEGTVKEVIPDVHADFIFAVAGEEFGLISCLIILLLFAGVVVGGYSRLLKDKNLFVVLAVAGILSQFGLQALINMASTLNMIPTKGMTLPFISYGGSSLLALGIGMGFVLALTRKGSTAIRRS